MKKSIFYGFLFSLSLLYLASCSEVGPVIDLGGNKSAFTLNDTCYTETPQATTPKVVVIEEYTGVRCQNCPTGHDIVNNLLAANPTRLIGVAMHSKFLDQTYGSDPVLTCLKADSIATYLGWPGVKPSASIDRVKWPDNGITGVPGRIIDYGLWSSKVSIDTALSSPINIKIYDSLSPSNDLYIQVETHYTTAMSEINKLTVYLTEDSIIASQLQPDGSTVIPNYVHSHVLRDVVTTYTGDQLGCSGTTTYAAGYVAVKRYKYPLSGKSWDLTHLKVVAFVHKNSGSTYDVVQAKAARVK